MFLQYYFISETVINVSVKKICNTFKFYKKTKKEHFIEYKYNVYQYIFQCLDNVIWEENALLKKLI